MAFDKKFMEIALKEAKKALDRGDYPIGAVLVINGKLVDKKSNRLRTDKDWISHAELALIRENSKTIKKNIKKNSAKIELYTTVEPCLMCLGAALLNRISRIIYACPDPHGGATKLNPKKLPNFYRKKWPKIDAGLFKEKSYKYMIEFMKTRKDPSWQKIRKMFEKMKAKW